MAATFLAAGCSSGDRIDAAPAGSSHRLREASASPDRATPARPGKPPALATPAPSADAGELEPAAMTAEQKEWLNDGCHHRKNTNVISQCSARKATGAWEPTKAEIGAALKLGGGLCYCAKPIEKAALTCMDSAKAPLVSVTVGKLEDPTDCTVTVTTFASGGRHWVRMLADNRDRATFYAVEVIALVEGETATAYYEGFEPLTDELARNGAEGVSVRLQSEWSKLPDDVKAWLTTR